MTPGARSTEFWLAAGGVLFGALLCMAGLVLARDVAIASGALLQATVVVGYAHSRGRWKSAKDAPRPYLPPAGRL